MTKKHLLQAALEKQQTIRELESQIEVAKLNYCEAVREMHLNGMSLREIAVMLKVSHQRIHQIIDEGSIRARSWLQPITSDLLCSFCGLASSQVNKMVAGPDVFICMCDACANDCSEILKTGKPIKTEKVHFQLLDKTARLRCSFCDKLQGSKRPMVAGKQHQICAPCLELALKYMKENVCHPGLS